MIKIFLAGLLFVLMASCQRHVLPMGVPAKIKLMKNINICVRTEADSVSPLVGTAEAEKVYQVVDAFPTYYLIALPSGKRGWIYANIPEKWTTLVMENQVKINMEGGISVRTKPYDIKGQAVGVAATDYIFDIIDTTYSHYRIILPDGKKGWIYCGGPDDKWIKPVY